MSHKERPSKTQCWFPDQKGMTVTGVATKKAQREREAGVAMAIAEREQMVKMRVCLGSLDSSSLTSKDSKL